MTATLSALYRYPIKGFKAEPLEAARIVPGQALEGDRKLAVTRGDGAFEPDAAEPWPKAMFLTVMRYPALAAIDTAYDFAGHRLAACFPDIGSQRYALGEAGERRRFSDHLRAYLGLPPSWRPELVASAERRFTDASVEGPRLMETLSLINLATLADLARRGGRTVDARRFRANLYIEGLPAWSEFDWIGREFSIGAVRFQGLLRTPRCAAIEANPDTGERDMTLMKLMRAERDDHHCGIQIEAVSAGRIAPGDTVAG